MTPAARIAAAVVLTPLALVVMLPLIRFLAWCVIVLCVVVGLV